MAVDWYNFIRDICAQYFIDHLAIIGGPGVEVEIDESKFGKKYNRGRQVGGHWVFGGTERITGECFLVEVEHRDAATLLPLENPATQFVLAVSSTAMNGRHTVELLQLLGCHMRP